MFFRENLSTALGETVSEIQSRCLRFSDAPKIWAEGRSLRSHLVNDCAEIRLVFHCLFFHTFTARKIRRGKRNGNDATTIFWRLAIMAIYLTFPQS